jgi:hypothetical protein
MKPFFLFLTLVLIGCGSSDEPAPPPVTPGNDAAVDMGPPAPGPGDPPACPGEPAVGTPPIPRGDHAGVLDTTGKKLVIFGGDTDVALCGEIPKRKHVDETFVLDIGCGTWRPIAATGPSARSRHVMVTDPRRDRALVFGGRTRTGTTGPYTQLNDLWGFDFTAETWTKLETSGTTPSPRSNAAAVYDKKRDRMIVFGGNTNTSGTAFTPLDETFALNLEFREWKQIGMGGTKPTARLFHGAAIDDDADKLYVFGGGDENAFTGPFFNDLWVLDLATDVWSKVAATGQIPQGRIQFGMSFDSGNKRVVVVAGHDDGKVGNQNDIHLFDVATNAWIRLNVGDKFNKPSTATCVFPPDFTVIDPLAPERRSAFAFAPTKDGRGFIMHAGKSDCGLLGDVMWFNVLNETFFPITKVPVGLSCLRYSETCSGLCG